MKYHYECKVIHSFIRFDWDEHLKILKMKYFLKLTATGVHSCRTELFLRPMVMDALSEYVLRMF